MNYSLTDTRQTAFKTVSQGIMHFDPFQAESHIPLAIVVECIAGWTDSMRRYDRYDNPYLYPQAS